MKKYLLVLFCISLFYSCILISPSELIQLEPEEFQQEIQVESAFVVDVHIPEQIHIEGTDLFIAFNTIKENLDKFPEDKNTPIFLYCRTGHMANIAARDLLEEGYKNIYNLDGGTAALEKANLPYN